eukprot:TRINITY_DN208_c1_g1_i1.p1 TRINITY_DN208_c1_g1~~TRINITY_DN208_c1_g1_i1.p1  ORF type:complete len:408 (-),score=122.25 TRINITY_DN208_c1_g1_i1:1265-2488(-)
MTEEDHADDQPEEEYALLAVQQYLHEMGYDESLRTLERESGRQYRASALPMSSELAALITEHRETKAAERSAEGAASGVPATDLEELNKTSDKNLICKLVNSFQNLGSSNLLCVKFNPTPDSKLIAVGATDHHLYVCDWTTGAVLHSIALPGAVIYADWHPAIPNILLASTLAFTHHVIDISATDKVVQSFKDHSKYAVIVRWSIDGSMFATASYDKSVKLYKATAAALTYECVHTWVFSTVVEALTFAPDGSIYAAMRENNYIHILNPTDYTTRLVNMNATGDDHVSFTVLDMSVSPSGNFLLLSTDRSRLIILHAATGQQVRNFYGAPNDDYSQPRHAWDTDGLYIYSTAQDFTIRAWEVATQQPVARLEGHTKRVRAVDHHPHCKLLASVGFDNCLKLWGPDTT